MSADVPLVIAVHAFMRGTGKSMLVARLAALIGRERRVLIVDADLGAPSLATIAAPAANVNFTVNDLLVAACEPAEAIVPVPALGDTVFLLPASEQPLELMRAARAGVPLERLHDVITAAAREVNAQVIIVDVAAGLGEHSLPAIALAEAFVLVLRLDQQDYQGSGVTVDVARRLGVSEAHLVVNMVPARYAPREAEETVSRAYACPAVAVPFTLDVDDIDAALEPFARALLERLAAGGAGLGGRDEPRPFP